MITPPAEPAPAQSAVVVTLSGGALVQEIKKELKRVGCYSGRIDEKWATAETKASMAKFVRYATASSAVEPSADLLDALRGKHERVCPQECSAREVESNGQCIAKACPASSTLGRDGSCEKKKERTAARPADGDRSARQSGSGKEWDSVSGDATRESYRVRGAQTLHGQTVKLTAQNGRTMTCVGGVNTDGVITRKRRCSWN